METVCVVAPVLFQISGVHHGWVCKVPENNSAVGTNNIRGENLPQASVVHIGTLRVLSVRGDIFPLSTRAVVYTSGGCSLCEGEKSKIV